MPSARTVGGSDLSKTAHEFLRSPRPTFAPNICTVEHLLKTQFVLECERDDIRSGCGSYLRGFRDLIVLYEHVPLPPKSFNIKITSSTTFFSLTTPVAQALLGIHLVAAAYFSNGHFLNDPLALPVMFFFLLFLPSLLSSLLQA